MIDKDDDPQIVEAFARFGRAIYMANVVEMSLVQTLLQVEFFTPAREKFIKGKGKGFDPKIFGAELDAYVEKQSKKTMGTLNLRVSERTVTKKEAARRQITAAIEHYEKGEYECAITLAGAAEGQFTAKDDDSHLFSELRGRRPPEFGSESEWVNWLNASRDWLKHPTPQWGDEWVMDDFGAGLMVLRAINKFNWVYRQVTQRMVNFEDQWRKSHLPKPN
jgi:hypothetical protein